MVHTHRASRHRGRRGDGCAGPRAPVATAGPPGRGHGAWGGGRPPHWPRPPAEGGSTAWPRTCSPSWPRPRTPGGTASWRACPRGWCWCTGDPRCRQAVPHDGHRSSAPTGTPCGSCQRTRPGVAYGRGGSPASGVPERRRHPQRAPLSRVLPTLPRPVYGQGKLQLVVPAEVDAALGRVVQSTPARKDDEQEAARAAARRSGDASRTKGTRHSPGRCVALAHRAAGQTPWQRLVPPREDGRPISEVYAQAYAEEKQRAYDAGEWDPHAEATAPTPGAAPDSPRHHRPPRARHPCPPCWNTRRLWIAAQTYATVPDDRRRIERLPCRARLSPDSLSIASSPATS